MSGTTHHLIPQQDGKVSGQIAFTPTCIHCGKTHSELRASLPHGEEITHQVCGDIIGLATKRTDMLRAGDKVMLPFTGETAEVTDVALAEKTIWRITVDTHGQFKRLGWQLWALPS